MSDKKRPATMEKLREAAVDCEMIAESGDWVAARPSLRLAAAALRAVAEMKPVGVNKWCLICLTDPDNADDPFGEGACPHVGGIHVSVTVVPTIEVPDA